MRLSLLDWLRDPVTGSTFDSHAFVERCDPCSGVADIVEGLLVAKTSGQAYAITDGVPVMLANGIPAAFVKRHREAIEKIHRDRSLAIAIAPATGFSFSQEWETHWHQKAVRTWGWTLAE